MQTVPGGGLALWKSMSSHKAEHLKVSQKIRVCLVMSGDQRVKMQQKPFPSCHVTRKSTLGV